MVMGWCTTAEAVVYERARPLKRPEEGGGGGDRIDRVGVGNVIPGGVAFAPLAAPVATFLRPVGAGGWGRV